MKKLAKVLCCVLLSLVILMTATACDVSNPSSSGNPTTSKAPGATEPAKGQELKLWIFLNPESTEDARCVVLKNLVEKYNSGNKYNNKIVVEYMNWDKIETAAIQAAAAGTGPDILNFFSDYYKTHISGGTVQPMTSFAEEYVKNTPDYLYNIDKLRVNGEIYGLPWETRVYVYWYRNDIYDRVPKTLDEMVEMTSAKTDSNGLGFALGMSEGSHASTFMESFIPWLRAAGGTFLDENGKAAFNTDAGVRAFNTMKALYDKGSMNNSVISFALDDIQDGFKAGTLYAISVGSHRSASLFSSSLKDKFSSAPIPGYEEGKPAPALVAGQTLTIGKYSKDPAGSFDFITEAFLSKETQKEFMKANTMPVRTTLYDDLEVKALESYQRLKMWNEYASTGSITIYPEDYAELSVELVKAAQNVVFKNADPKQELDRVAQWYNSK